MICATEKSLVCLLMPMKATVVSSIGGMPRLGAYDREEQSRRVMLAEKGWCTLERWETRRKEIYKELRKHRGLYEGLAYLMRETQREVLTEVNSVMTVLNSALMRRSSS